MISQNATAIVDEKYVIPTAITMGIMHSQYAFILQH